VISSEKEPPIRVRVSVRVRFRFRVRVRVRAWDEIVCKRASFQQYH